MFLMLLMLLMLLMFVMLLIFYDSKTQRPAQQRSQLPSPTDTGGNASAATDHVNTALGQSGDKDALRSARANLNWGVRAAKRAYGQKVQSHFTDSKNPRRLWQGIQSITDYKPCPVPSDDDTDFLNILNTYFSWFEEAHTTTITKATLSKDDEVLSLDSADVRRTLHRVIPRKAAGPDNIPGYVFKECAEQLVYILTDIYNISLSQAIVPQCFKATTIMPLPKKSPALTFNGYRPVALTPIMMKCFKKLVKDHIMSRLPAMLDLIQFAYRPNRSTDDAISAALHQSLTHLENKNSCVDAFH
ncbi:hypothetical protein P4O66_002199 [Electrophorus voltai]|uniref:Reverse transcriptase domain-containing protein n=1 Tax=Electrophorus voltai TaxID=2609070 RepID=A0AAD8Z1D6_9TELE|nr:hypothetical protein P4O66_002199 [Electrophorus voltai]